MTMNIDVKEMSFTELKTQLEILQNEIEYRKRCAVKDYLQIQTRLQEHESILYEMGIDPATVILTQVIGEDTNDESSLDEPFDTIDVENNDSDIEIILDEITPDGSEPIESEMSEDGDGKPDQSLDESMDSEIIDIDVEDSTIEYLPSFYRLLEELKSRKKEKKENDSKEKSVKRKKPHMPKLRTPFYRYIDKSPNKESLYLGNIKNSTKKTDYPENECVSSNGVAPTLTATHCDVLVWVGKDPRSYSGAISLPT